MTTTTPATSVGATSDPGSGTCNFYAVYRTSVTNYYYSGSAYTSRTLYRNQTLSSTSAMGTTYLSTSSTGLSNYSTAGGPNSSTWYGLSTALSSTTRTYSTVAAAAASTSATLNTIYQFVQNFSSAGSTGVTNIGSTAEYCYVSSTSASAGGTSCTVTTPTISVSTGYSSLGWGAQGHTTQGTAESTSITVSTSGGTLYANAKINQYTCTKRYRLQNADGTWGSYTSDGTESLDYGTSCSYSKSVADYKNTASGTNNAAASSSCTITTSGCTVSLDFYRNTYTLTVSRNTTHISSASATTSAVHGDNYYRWGQAVSITAAANTGSKFTSWTQSGTTGTFGSATSASTTFTMGKGNSTVTAGGTYDTYTIPLNHMCPTTSTGGSTSTTATYYSTTLGSITLPSCSNGTSTRTVSGFTAGTNASGATISSTSTLNSTATTSYTFDGWRTGPLVNHPNVANAASTPVLVADITDYTDSYGRWIKAGGAPLYARWNQSTGSYSSVTLPTITKRDYSCGWSTDSAATSFTYGSGGSIVPSSNLTLYGICVQNDRTITYDYQQSNFGSKYYTSANTAYLDTGYIIDWNKDFEINETFYIGTLGQRYCIICNYQDSDETLNIEINASNKLRLYMQSGSISTTSGTVVKDTAITIKFTWDTSTREYNLRATASGMTTIEIDGIASSHPRGLSSKTLLVNRDHRSNSQDTFKSLSRVTNLTIKTAAASGNPFGTLPSVGVSHIDKEFRGWYTSSTGGQKVEESDNVRNIYAIWTTPDTTQAMQTMSDSYCTTTAKTVKDSRDNKQYKVQRLADGKCWMLDNLRLDPTAVSLATLQGNTNASNTTLNYLKNGGGTTSDKYATAGVSTNWTGHNYSAPLVNTTKIDTTTTSYGSGSGKVGVYYNYCAASAGSYCYGNGSSSPGTPSADTTEDLCPSGWRMPTSGSSSGEIKDLYIAYSSNATNFRNAISVPLSGYYYYGSGFSDGRMGEYGYILSSTRNGSQMIYNLHVDADGVEVAGHSGKRYTGYPMRCVKIEGEENTMQTMSDSDCTTTATTVVDSRDGEQYKVQRLADGKCWMLDNLRLDPTSVSLSTLKGNTNASDTALTYFKNGGGSSPYPSTGVAVWGSSTSWTVPYVYTASKDDVSTATYSNTGSNKKGVYYNYCAASAGSYCFSSSGGGSGNITEDICPSGWKIPSGNTSGIYGSLSSAYSNVANDVAAALSWVKAGYILSSSPTNGGSSGSGEAWATTQSNYGGQAYYMGITGTNSSPTLTLTNNRDQGLNVRCVLK